MVANRYVFEVPAEAHGRWAVLVRAPFSRLWVVSRLLEPGTLEVEATRAYHRLARRLLSGEVALVDPRGQESDYRQIAR